MAATVFVHNQLSHSLAVVSVGHSGETASKSYFEELDQTKKKGITEELTENQFNDFLKFEGNAKAFRILTTIFLKNGFKLTFATLASIIKYPTNSTHGFDKQTGLVSTKNSGFFDAEILYYQEIGNQLGLNQIDEIMGIETPQLRG